MGGSWTYNTPAGTPTDGIQITVVCIAFTIAASIFVSMRMYVRVVMIKAFGFDDGMTLLALAASAGFAIITIIQTKWGLGLLSLEDNPTENIFHFGYLQFIGAPFYITSILGFKLALLLSYLRFIHAGFWRWAVIITIVLCCLFHLSFLIVQVNLCQPVAKQWDPSITTGSCIPGVPFYTSMAALTMLFDVAVMVLPFPVLYGAKIQNRKKIVLLVLLGTGVFITIIQIIRIQTIHRLSNYLDSAPLIMWSAVENNLGIMVACVPTLAPLFKYFKDASTSSKTPRSSDRYGSGNRYGVGTNNGGGNYALKSWASRSDRRGMKRLSNGDVYPAGSTPRTIGQASSGTGSTDSILGGKSAGIVKSTNIHIVSYETRAP